MPYEVRQSGSQFCVYKKGTDKKFGCHPSHAEANKQLAALYANEATKMTRKKRILRGLIVDEISGVDKAAQAPAQALLRKRYDDEDLAKAQFTAEQRRQLASEGKAMPDGSYPIRNRSDLSNAIQAFGRASNKGAVAAWIKRRAKALGAEDLLPAEGALAKNGGEEEYDRPLLTTMVSGHQHVLDDCGAGGETSWARSEGADFGHEHPWVRMLDGRIVIGAAEGHTHDLISADTIVVSANKFAAQGGNGHTQGDNAMANDNPTAQGDEIPEAVQKSINELTARAERAEAIAKLNADERSLFDNLDATGQGEFLAKSASARAEQIREAQAADKIVYKALNGDVFRASDDPRLVKAIREGDEERERTRKALEVADNIRMEKRADEELSHAPGTVQVRAGILKALEGVSGAPEFLKAADAALAKFFKPTGTSSTDEELLKAEDRLEVLAKKHQEANPGMSLEVAMAEILETPEGSKLYAETIG